MNTKSIICLGDVMLELINDDELEVQYQRTLVFQSREAVLGGAVVNLCWYLSHLGHHTSIATHYGPADHQRVDGLLSHMKLSSRFLAEKRSTTDILIVLRRLQIPSLYLRGALDRVDIEAILSGILDVGVVIFGGSRHSDLRSEFLARVSSFDDALIIFSPSYTVYEYSAEEMTRFLEVSDIVFVNEHEASYMCDRLNVKTIADVMKMAKAGGVVTLGSKGADLYPGNQRSMHIPSISGRTEDVIGAGEAFLCGFLHGYLMNRSWRISGEVGCAVAAQVVMDGRVRAPIDQGLLPLPYQTA